MAGEVFDGNTGWRRRGGGSAPPVTFDTIVPVVDGGKRRGAGWRSAARFCGTGAEQRPGRGCGLLFSSLLFNNQSTRKKERKRGYTLVPPFRLFRAISTPHARRLLPRSPGGWLLPRFVARGSLWGGGASGGGCFHSYRVCIFGRNTRNGGTYFTLPMESNACGVPRFDSFVPPIGLVTKFVLN